MNDNNPLVLGLDLDGTISNYYKGLSDYMLDHGIIDHELPAPDKYSIIECAGWPFKNYDDYLKVHRAAVDNGLYDNLEMLEGANATLDELSGLGVHIRIVTHRLFTGGQHAKVVTDTVRWLDEHDIDYKSICFTGLKDSVGADLYVEDSPGNIALLRRAGYRCLTVDQPYNKEVKGPRILSWTGATELIMNELHAGRIGWFEHSH